MNKLYSLTTILALTMLAVCLTVDVAVAQIDTPVASPYATVSEQVGITNITITYGRPGINGRPVWGSLVPYGYAAPFPGFGSGNPVPWRAGANENTTITFEHDVLIEGKKLAAGTYGLHMVPSDKEWTIIFSNNSTSWGSFFYDESEDALRVTVTPEAAPNKERLMYEFTNHDGPGAADIALRWEELMVPFRVEIDDLHGVVMAEARNALRSRGGFGPTGYTQAANYALQNDVNMEEAMLWAEVAVRQNRNFNTLQIKASLLAKTGNGTEADAVMGEAMELANEQQLNAYGYQLMGQQRLDDAMAVFQTNVERHPDSWNVYDSLAEAYANKGDTKNARKHYKTALAKVPANDQANKDRINGILANMEAGSN